MDKPDTPMKPDKRLILIIDENQITIPKIQDESYFEDYKIVVFEDEIRITKSKVQYPDDVLMMFTFLHEEDRIKNPDQEHFDKMMIGELVWKLDREVWAHVQNPEPSNEWSTSKAREETKKLLIEYLGNSDEQRQEISDLKKEIERLKAENEDLGYEIREQGERS